MAKRKNKIEVHALLADLHKVAARLGTDSLRRDDYEAYGRYSVSLVRLRFGCWSKALKAAGLKLTTHPNTHTSELLADLKRVARQCGKSTLTANEYAREGTFGVQTSQRRFGGWNKAIIAAGLTPSVEVNIPAIQLLDDLRRVSQFLGSNVMSREEYEQHGRYSHQPCIRCFGSWQAALAATGLQDARVRSRQPRLWPLERVETEYRKAYERLGTTPTAVSLKKFGLTALASVIQKRYPGGIQALRQKFGHPNPYKPRGFYCDPTTIESEYKRIAKQVGHPPTYKELQQLGHCTLAAAIIERYPGKTQGLQIKLGYPTRKQSPYKKWEGGRDHRVVTPTILRHMEQEYLRLSQHLGHSAKFNELRAMGHGDLAQGIINCYPGKYSGIRAALRMPIGRRGHNYWSVKRVEAEYRALSRKLGHPASTEEVKIHNSPLLSAIHNHYPGGLVALAIKLGGRPKSRKNYWSSSTIEKTYKKLAVRLGRNPSATELKKLDPGLAIAVSKKYPGGMHGLRDALGIPQSRRKQGYWQIWENLRTALKKWLDKYGAPLTEKRLRSTGHSNLVWPVSRYHGGFPKVRRYFGVPLSGDERARKKPVPRGHWEKWENAELVIREFVERYGHFPTSKELRTIPRIGILGAIHAHGGFAAVRARMGFGRPIHNTAGFVRMLEVERPQKARGVLKDLLSHFGDDLVDVADILAVVYTGRLEAKTAMEILQDPTMRPWIVPFDGRGHGPGKPPIGDDFPFYLLEKDKNGVIAGIIRRRLTEWRRKVLGARPSQEARAKFLRELRTLQEKFRTNGGKEVAPAAE